MIKKIMATVMLIVVLAFVTANAAVVGELSVLDTSVAKPSGGAWEVGDQYRLVFVTSETTQATSTDITTYNEFVQAVAAAVGLGNATWNVIGSTATVDARDNTGTNRDNAAHVSVPIFLIDGRTKIADNNTDLWNGNIDALINIDEKGSVVNTGVWTGTDPDGEGHTSSEYSPGQVLGGSGQTTPKTQIGSAEKTSGYWTRYFNYSTTDYYPVYALSEPLTIQEGPPSVDAGHRWVTWDEEPVTLDPTVVNNDTQNPPRDLVNIWTAEPAAGVSITEDGSAPDDPTTPAAVVTVTKAADTNDATVITLMLSVAFEGEEETGPWIKKTTTIDVHDNSCKAAAAVGREVTYDTADFNKDCIIDIEDLAEMAEVWLEDYSLIES